MHCRRKVALVGIDESAASVLAAALLLSTTITTTTITIFTVFLGSLLSTSRVPFAIFLPAPLACFGEFTAGNPSSFSGGMGGIVAPLLGTQFAAPSPTRTMVSPLAIAIVIAIAIATAIVIATAIDIDIDIYIAIGGAASNLHLAIAVPVNMINLLHLLLLLLLLHLLLQLLLLLFTTVTKKSLIFRSRLRYFALPLVMEGHASPTAAAAACGGITTVFLFHPLSFLTKKMLELESTTKKDRRKEGRFLPSSSKAKVAR